MSKRPIPLLEKLEVHLKELKELIEPQFKSCPGCGKPNRFKGMKRKTKVWPYCSKRCKEVEERKTVEEFAKMMRELEIETQHLEQELDSESSFFE